MKKTFLLSALMATFGLSTAQEVQTYSVYDTDQSGDLNVGDAVGVADKVVQNVSANQTQQYVTAEDLRALLQVIDAKLEKLSKLDALESRLNSLEQMQSAMALESGVEVPGKVHLGHEYVDLGITDASGKTIYWATCNVGASSPEDYGDYYAWGETTTKSTYDWSTYKYCNGSETTMTKYCTESDYGTVDNKTVLDSEDDAATANWGGSWRMPTFDEHILLGSQCYWQWVESYNGKGVNGYVVYKAKADADKGKYPYIDSNTSSYVTPSPEATYSVSSDAHIFLPAAGCRFDSSLGSAGFNGLCWSSSLYTSGLNFAGYLYFSGSSYVDWNYYYRCQGLTVRPVCQ